MTPALGGETRLPGLTRQPAGEVRLSERPCLKKMEGK